MKLDFDYVSVKLRIETWQVVLQEIDNAIRRGTDPERMENLITARRHIKSGD